MADLKLAAPGSFANRTVIVTGAAGSIGRPLSIAFAKAGANVVINDLGGSAEGAGSSNSPAEKVAEEIRALGYKKVVADYHSVIEGDKIVDTAIKSFGGLDVIVNNAGIIKYGSFEEKSVDEFRNILETNTLGPITLIKAAWPHFKEKGYGRVVNFTSDSCFGMEGASSYILSKSALIGVTKALALEGAASGIKLNVVAPTSYSRMAGDTISDEAQREMFKTVFRGEGNAPMILALAHESNEFSGEVFSLGAYSINKVVLGVVKGTASALTMEDCFKQQSNFSDKGREVYTPSSLGDYMAWKGAALSV